MDYFNIEKVDLIKTVQYQNSCSNELEIRTLELRNPYTGFCLLILRQMQLMLVHSYERSELPAIFVRTDNDLWANFLDNYIIIRIQ